MTISMDGLQALGEAFVLFTVITALLLALGGALLAGWLVRHAWKAMRRQDRALALRSPAPASSRPPVELGAPAVDERSGLRQRLAHQQELPF